MSYSIEQSRNINLDNTDIPNLFIGDIMPDITDGDYLKVYIYAYMCSKNNLQITHVDIADKLGITVEKVVKAWQYFESRKIVRLIQMEKEGALNFDVEFVDIKGMLFVKNKGASESSVKKADKMFDNARLKDLFSNIANISDAPTFDGDDAQKVYSWITKHKATPEIIEGAYLFARDTKGNTKTEYVEKIVKKWAEAGLKNKQDINEYLAATDEKHQVYKKLMAALGMRYQTITDAEKKIFNTWMDDYGYTPNQLLEMAEKTVGVSGNKLLYMGGIIKNERAKEGKTSEKESGKKSSFADRNDRYRAIREANEEQAEKNREEVYGAAPEIKRVDDEISYLNMELMKALTSRSNNKKAIVERINKKITEKTSERARLMEKAGFSADYTDINHNCEKCKDTGLLEDSTSCDCLNVQSE